MNAKNQDPNHRQETALARASAGVPIFPLTANTKITISGCLACTRYIRVDGKKIKNPDYTCKNGRVCPCIADGNPNGNTCHGCYAGTTNHATITYWFGRYEDMNYGEHLINRLVIDDDWDLEGENPAFTEYRALHGDFPETRVVKTPGGLHRDYLLPDGTDIYRGAAAFGKRLLGRKTNDSPTKVDVKGGPGHYSVGAGSVVDGQLYYVTNDVTEVHYPQLGLLEKSRVDSERPEAGEYLHVQVTADDLGSFERSFLTMEIDRLIKKVKNAPPGEWDSTVYFVSADIGKYVVHGLIDEGDAIESLVEAALSAGLEAWEEPDDDDEVFAKVERGIEYGKAQGLEAEILEEYGISVTDTVSTDTEAATKSEKPGSLSDRLNQSIVDWDEAFSFDPSSIHFLPGGFAREGDYISIIGDGKVGKSVLCHDWAWRMSTAGSFLGSAMDEAIPVLYLDRENPIQVYVDHFRSYGATPSTMGDLTFMSYPPMPPLDTAEGGKVFLELIKQTGAKVVFLDTISRFVEGDENANDTWLKVYRNCIVALREYDPSITVVRIDHFGKDKSKGGRGGSAKEQDVDSVYELKKENGSSFKLERTHTRTGIGPEEIRFTRSGRVLDNQWAAGETSHDLIPAWKVAGPTKASDGLDKTSIEGMVRMMDNACIPDGDSGWGLNKAKDWLRDNGATGSTAVLQNAQKQRKARSDHETVCPIDCQQR
ncbi:hypothetical protein QFZ22_003765 [Streptomyces canus]|uniref:DNA primase/polymerase bifunctional N-terminal domain-containing protein n=1 Tax=Streptomyces canus TaxID=58343 RepID=A0AAW8FFE2_9ACTN|nr:AAA family ATPase [Streptomyces canus]MDQ0907780.1 hypothetical protein [Streptomyces canus]